MFSKELSYAKLPPPPAVSFPSPKSEDWNEYSMSSPSHAFVSVRDVGPFQQSL